MGIFKFLNKNTKNIADKIDESFYTEEERGADALKVLGKKQEVVKLVSETIVEDNKNVTKRHEVDMLSDNKMAKIIRPSLAIGIFVTFTALIGINFFQDIKFSEGLLQYLELVKMVLMFYFGGRTAEKLGRMFLDAKGNK